MKSISVRAALAAAAPDLLDKSESFGSVAVQFSGASSQNIFAATIPHRIGSPIMFHFDGDDSGIDSGITSTEGIWWLPRPSLTEYLVLSNPSSKPATARLRFTDGQGNSFSQALPIGAGRMQRVNLAELMPQHFSTTSGGVSVATDGTRGVSALEIVFDETTGFSALIKMFDRYPQASQVHTTRAPMMALQNPDPALALGDGAALQPTVFLRNTTASPLSLSAGINWKSSTNQGHFDLPAQVLPANSVQTVDLTQFLGPKAIPADANWGTVILSYKGQPADLVAFATSFDVSGQHGVQTPFTEGTAAVWKGGMWHADALHNTIIIVGNGGSKPVNAGLVLHYDGGAKSYQRQLQLAPGDQMWTNIGDLIATQVPDSSGRSLPPSVGSGSYEVIDLDHRALGQIYEGKIVVDKTFGRGFYGCAVCCGQGPAAFKYSPASWALGYSDEDLLQSYDACEGENIDVTEDAYNWNSNTSVITFDGYGDATAVGVGISTDSASFDYNTNDARHDCPPSGSNPRHTHNVCAAPLSETSTLYGTLNVTEGVFVMTLNPSTKETLIKP